MKAFPETGFHDWTHDLPRMVARLDFVLVVAAIHGLVSGSVDTKIGADGHVHATGMRSLLVI